MTQGSGWEGVLQESESILSLGQPETGIIWTGILFLQALLERIFTTFSAFWIGGAASARAGIGIVGTLFPLFGRPFLAAGPCGPGVRVSLDAYTRSTTPDTSTDRAAFFPTSSCKRALASTPGNVLVASNVGRKDSEWQGLPRRIGFRHILEARANCPQMRVLHGAQNNTNRQAGT